jgi:hypothetical protein
MENNDITQKNMEVLENFFNEIKQIIYRGHSKKSQMKMLYGARYWANYFMQMNNAQIRKLQK